MNRSTLRFEFLRIIDFLLTYIYVSSLLLSSGNICGTMRLELTLVDLLVVIFFRFCIGLFRGHCCVLDFFTPFHYLYIYIYI